jgi:DNA invertase Pin-like site-specific DNA recombinase
MDESLEVNASSRRSAGERKVELLLARLAPGDLLIVNELSRLGRSVGGIIPTVNTLVKRHIRLLAIKEGIRLYGVQHLQTGVIVRLFGLFAEIEREMLSQRAKEALAAARVAGKQMGRP